MGEAEGPEVLKLAEEKARSDLIAIGAIWVTPLLYTSKKRQQLQVKAKGISVEEFSQWEWLSSETDCLKRCVTSILGYFQNWAGRGPELPDPMLI